MPQIQARPTACPVPPVHQLTRDPLKVTRAPYRKAHGACGQARAKVLTAARISPKTRLALLGVAFQEDQAGRAMTWIPHQLAPWGGCDVRTIYRDLPELVAHGLVQLVEEGNRGARRAAVYRLGQAFPEWAGFTSARSRHESRKPVRVTKSPSPGELRSPRENPPGSLHREPAAPSPRANVRSSARKGRELPQAEREARERVRGLLLGVKASSRAIGAVMGRGRKTWQTWGRAVKVAEDALKVLELRGEGPSGIREAHKFLTKALLRPDLGLSLRTTIRRWRGRCRALDREAEAQVQAREDQVREAMGAEAYQAAQAKARADALEAQRYRAAAAEAHAAQELRQERRKKRAEDVATKAWAAVMAEAQALEAQAEPTERGRLQDWKTRATPGDWALAVFRSAGAEDRFDAMVRTYHELRRKADRI